MVSTLEQMQVPNGAGPGVRRSKRPLLASHTRCNVLLKPPKFGKCINIPKLCIKNVYTYQNCVLKMRFIFPNTYKNRSIHVMLILLNNTDTHFYFYIRVHIN